MLDEPKTVALAVIAVVGIAWGLLGLWLCWRERQ